jgi:hypothetical protein
VRKSWARYGGRSITLIVSHIESCLNWIPSLLLVAKARHESRPTCGFGASVLERTVTQP